jgi:hypothetical protein
MQHNWLDEYRDLLTVYSVAQLAQLAYEMDYLYEMGTLPADAEIIERAELHGDTWMVVHRERRMQ